MDNVVSINRKSDVQQLIEGCAEDMRREDKFSLQHYHTMWVLKEIMMNPNNSEEDRLSAAFIAYDNSGYRSAIDHLLGKFKHTNTDAQAVVHIREEFNHLMCKLCNAKNEAAG